MTLWLLTHGPAQKALGLILAAAAILLFVIVLTITCINLLVSKKHVYYS